MSYEFFLFIFVEVYFMTQDMVFLGKCSGHLKRMCAVVWVECSVNVNSILLVNGVEFFCILANFLFSSISY